MTNSELKDKINELYSDQWKRLPGIYRFDGRKTIIWFALIALCVILSGVCWYMLIELGSFGTFEVDPESADPHAVFVGPENLELNMAVMFMSFIFLATGGILLLIFFKARKLEKKIYSEASRHAAHISEKEREKEFREQLELRNIEQEEIEEIHRNMKAEFCPKCGLLMIPGNNTCPSCGTVAGDKET